MIRKREMLAYVKKSSYLCTRIEEDASTSEGCGSALAKRACHTALTLLTFVTTLPIKCTCWLSLLQKFALHFPCNAFQKRGSQCAGGRLRRIAKRIIKV